jgi:hypothetical protein
LDNFYVVQMNAKLFESLQTTLKKEFTIGFEENIKKDSYSSAHSLSELAKEKSNPAPSVSPEIMAAYSEFSSQIPDLVKKILRNQASDAVKHLMGRSEKDEKFIPSLALLFPDLLNDAIVASASSASANLAVGSDSMETRGTRMSSASDLSQLSINGVQGAYLQNSLPVHLKIKGRMNSTLQGNMQGTMSFKSGNTVVGGVFGYSTEGEHFSHDGRQMEGSLLLSQSYHGLFLEGQFGVVSAKGVHGKEWNILRNQITVGWDLPLVTPFVQLSIHNHEHKNCTSAFVGVEVGAFNYTTDSYQYSQSLVAKVGMNGETIFGLDGRLNLSEGVAVSGSLDFDHKDRRSSISAGISR